MAELENFENSGVPADADEFGADTAEEQRAAASADDAKPDIPNRFFGGVGSLFCFPVTAVIALWFSAKVNEYLEAGDYDRARAASEKAGKLIKASLYIAPVWMITAIIIVVVLSKL